MQEKRSPALMDHFGELEDPRIDRQKQHKLTDVLVIAICAILCGANDWVAVETFGKAKQEWFQEFLELPNGIPSHDTFGRVFALLSPDQLQESFLSWVQAVTSWAFVNSRENTPPSRPMTSQVVAQIASFFNDLMVS